MIHHVSQNATEQHIKCMISRMSISRWLRNIWLAQRSAKLVVSTSRENGMLWGKLATVHDELKFVRRELDEVLAYSKMNPVSLASHYRVDAVIADEVSAPVRDKYQHVVIELVRMRQYVELGMLRVSEEAPDAVARKMAEDTGAQWVEQIYPKLAEALGVPENKRNASRLDHNRNRAVIDQRDSMIYGGKL